MRQSKEMTTWFLVADGARACVMATKGAGGPISPVFDYMMASEARAHPVDALTDRPGRSFDSTGRMRHAMEPRTDWRTQIKQDFAARLAGMVETAAVAGRFSRLVLVASPKILGMIRDALGRAGKRALAGSVCKDMTHLTDPELARRLQKVSVA